MEILAQPLSLPFIIENLTLPTSPFQRRTAMSVNRGSFYYTRSPHWIVMVGGILDAFAKSTHYVEVVQKIYYVSPDD
jgi:hypothetical protein